MILEYSKQIPRQIPKTVKEVLGVDVKSVKKLTGGEVSYSFRVNTDSAPLFLRVFRYPYPLEVSLRYIDRKLTTLGIEYSGIIHLDKSDRWFRNGFMVGEWIEGTPADRAIEKGLVKTDEVFFEVAKVLRRIHEVKFKKFGKPPFNKDRKGFESFPAFVMKLRGVEDLAKDELVSSDLIKVGKKQLKQLLEKINFPVLPIMVHGDPAPENVIWTQKGPVLIDWDSVKATSWVYDLAWMTYWWGKKVQKPFLKGYGHPKESPAQINLLERILHLALALGLLPYFAYDAKDKKRLRLGIQKLRKLTSFSS